MAGLSIGRQSQSNKMVGMQFISFYPIGVPILISLDVLMSTVRRGATNPFTIQTEVDYIFHLMNSLSSPFIMKSKTRVDTDSEEFVGIYSKFDMISRTLTVRLFRDTVVNGTLHRYHFKTQTSSPITSIERLMDEVRGLIEQLYEFYLMNCDVGHPFEIWNSNNLIDAPTGATREEMLANINTIKR